MIKFQRLHDEQIKKVAQSLKAPYHARNTESGKQEISGAVRTQIKSPEPAGTSQMLQLKSRSRSRKNTGMAPKDSRDERPLPQLNPVAVMQCIQCGDRFPVTDFLYTKKTCICISCWERKVV
jgi:hypothetical protein